MVRQPSQLVAAIPDNLKGSQPTIEELEAEFANIDNSTTVSWI
jgi:hypothetical protein